MLMTGAIGSILMTLAWLVLVGSFAFVFGMLLGGGTPSGSTAQSLGGVVFIAAVLLVGGSICQGIGFFGLKPMFGGVFMIAGIFTLLIGIGIILGILFGLIGSPSAAQATSYVLIASVVLQALFAGIGYLGGRSRATSGKGPMLLGGVTFLVAAVIFIVLFICGQARINIGITVAEILGYTWLGGTILGHIFSAVVMLGQRKGDAPAAGSAG
jgi:hypothetical protein